MKKNAPKRSNWIAIVALMLCCILTLGGCSAFVPEQNGSKTSGSMDSSASSDTNGTAPDNTELTPHEHIYEVVVAEATCGEAGYTTYTCTCGYSYQDGITEPFAHNWGEWIITKESTEETGGEYERSCAVCNEREIQTIEKTSHIHSYTGQVTKEASCTADGSKMFTCDCGASYTEIIAKSGHSYAATVTKEATCTTDGLKTFVCGCGSSYTEVIEGGHRYSRDDSMSERECGENPYYIYICSRCGYYEQKYTSIAPLAHTWGEWTIVKEATETEAGSMERICSNCKQLNEQIIFATKVVPVKYVDPRHELKIVGRDCVPKYDFGSLAVVNKATWEAFLSIYINENNGLDIIYYKQDGTKVEYTLNHPGEGYSLTLTIREDGSFVTRLNGDFSD